MSWIRAGKFDVVYSLLLSETKKIPEAVAVKTLKGQLYMHECIIIVRVAIMRNVLCDVYYV